MTHVVAGRVSLIIFCTLAPLALLWPSGENIFPFDQTAGIIWSLSIVVGAALIILPPRSVLVAVIALLSLTDAILLLKALDDGVSRSGISASFWCGLVALAALVWQGLDQLSTIAAKAPALFGRICNVIVPALFGLWFIYLWQIVVIALNVPAVLLPPPSAVVDALLHSLPQQMEDLGQTFLKSALAGYAIGCGSGVLVALVTDRLKFLQRGLLPLGHLVSALPIVGIAPIMVMWFGFDWQSKAAVVVVMTFFPMLVNTIAGLQATGRIERDLMQTYAANYRQTLLLVRLPTALPFIFNGLKINSTLALIGAIVAEFFGTPILGMGFRISTEVGRMNMATVWATIVMAALAGSLSYGLLAGLERRLTFWHPSFRQRA